MYDFDQIRKLGVQNTKLAQARGLQLSKLMSSESIV